MTLQPIRRFGFDAAILFSDILVVPHALGQRVTFEEGIGPRLKPLDMHLESLDPDGLEEQLAPIFETVRRVRRELPIGTPMQDTLHHRAERSRPR